MWSGLRNLALVALGAGGFACGRHEPAPAVRAEEGPEVRLAGRVVDARGTPLAGASVTGTCRRDGDDEHTSATTLTDEHGAFRIDELSFGAITLQASCAEHRPATLELGELGPIDEREGLELVLADGETLRGRVRRADGSAASGARVFLESEDGWACQELALDAQGAFTARALGEGAIRVTAIAQGDTVEACALASARGVLPGAENVELVLRPSGALEVVAHGTSAPDDVYTTVLDLDGREAARPWSVAGGELRAALPEGRLEPGAYWLHVEDSTHSLAALRRVEVAAGTTTRVELELVPATRLELSAPCGSEACLDELLIQGATGYRDRASFLTDIRLQGRHAESVLLPPGAYHLELTTDEGHATADVTLGGEPERELLLELE